MARGLEAQLAAFENASDDDDSSDGGGDSVDHDELARAGEAASSDDDESDGEADASDDEGYDSEAEARRRAKPKPKAWPVAGERLRRLEEEATARCRGDSSKKRPAARTIEGLKKKQTVRDPRFEALCGTYDAHATEKRYGWLDDHEAEEISRKQGQLKTKKGRKDAGLKAEVDDAVRKRKQRKHDERKRDVVRSMKREERTKVKAGKQPYYAKKSVVKQRLLEDRFDQLKKAGKLNGFLRKKARKPTSLLEAGARSREARGVVPRGAAQSARLWPL
ncbi:hypothetical protein JL720_1824 [Aureococcus anophagefferens]|nr:hypothetical protein JL720_1824 [Aureococcus anophagefferens]